MTKKELRNLPQDFLGYKDLLHKYFMAISEFNVKIKSDKQENISFTTSLKMTNEEREKFNSVCSITNPGYWLVKGLIKNFNHDAELKANGKIYPYVKELHFNPGTNSLDVTFNAKRVQTVDSDLTIDVTPFFNKLLSIRHPKRNHQEFIDYSITISQISIHNKQYANSGNFSAPKHGISPDIMVINSIGQSVVDDVRRTILARLVKDPIYRGAVYNPVVISNLKINIGKPTPIPFSINLLQDNYVTSEIKF